MQHITCAADMLCFQFGPLTMGRAILRDEDGGWYEGEALAGLLALQAQCSVCITCGDAILLASGDRFTPAQGVLARLGIGPEDDLPEDFDLGSIGNNRLDELLAAHFEPAEGLTVRTVSVGRHGALSIRLTDGVTVHITPDVSGPQECWRFFERGGDDHLVITGEGIEAQDDE